MSEYQWVDEKLQGKLASVQDSRGPVWWLADRCGYADIARLLMDHMKMHPVCPDTCQCWGLSGPQLMAVLHADGLTLPGMRDDPWPSEVHQWFHDGPYAARQRGDRFQLSDDDLPGMSTAGVDGFDGVRGAYIRYRDCG